MSLLLCLASVTQALPISSKVSAASLAPRQFFPPTTSSTTTTRSPTVFVAIGSIVVIGLVVSLLALMFSWRRKSRFGPSQLVNSGYDSNGRPIRGPTAGNARGPVNDKGQPVLTIAELNKLYPVISFADFVEASGKDSVITSSAASTHSAKTAAGNEEEKHTASTDSTTVKPTTSTMSTVPDHSHMFQPSSDNYVCAICQQNIGEEEPASRQMSVIDLDISAPVHPIDSEDITNNNPNNSSRLDGGLVLDLEKNAAATITETNISTADPVALTTGPAVSSVEPDKILIRQLPCHHIFHDACIVPWLTLRKACCPLCQFNLRKNIDFPTHSEGEDSNGNAVIRRNSTSTSSANNATDRQADSTDQVVRPEPARVRSVRVTSQPNPEDGRLSSPASASVSAAPAVVAATSAF